MTVPSTTRRAGPFTGTGALVAYPFTFKVFAKQDLAVTIADSNGLETDLVLDSTFTVTLNVDQEATPGGTVNYAVGGVATALPSGYTLVVTGDGLEFEQTADLPQGGNFSPVVIENALDRIVMLLQRLWDGVRRSMRLPDTASDNVSTVLPVPTANNFIGWDQAGTALQNVDPNTLATVVAFAAWQSQAFSGDGVTTQFTLSSNPGNVNNLDVVVGAVPQRNNVDFTLSGTTLTFDAAPANGISIFARWGQALPEGTSTLQTRLASSASAADGSGMMGVDFAVSTLRALLYVTNGRTAEEIAAAVTPSDYKVPHSTKLSAFRYGVIGSGLVDDAPALQRFFDAGGTDLPGPGYTLRLDSKVVISKANTKIHGHGTNIKHSATYSSGGSNTLESLRVTAVGVEISGIVFDGTAGVSQATYNCFIAYVAGAGKGNVHDCSFANLVTGSNAQAAILFLNGSYDGRAHHNDFDTCPGAVFSQAAGTIISHNTVREPSDVSFALNGTACIGGVVNGNYIYNTNTNCSAHIAAEEGASEWVISGNYMRGVKNGVAISALNVAVFTVVRGGIIADNLIDGGNLVASTPCAGIAVSEYYTNCDVHDNTIRRLPTAVASNIAIRISAGNSRLHNNNVDCSTNTYSACINIIPAGGAIEITNNRLNATGCSRGYMIGPGDFTNNRVEFTGGQIIGGTNGIDANLQMPTNCDLRINNHGEITSTTPLVVSTAITAYADWQTFFNAGSKSYPHSIRAQDRTVMYGDAAPAAGSGFPGGHIIRQTPVVGQPLGWVKVAGAWQPMPDL